MNRLLPAFFLAISFYILFMIPREVFADMRRQVLGTTTAPSSIQFPAISSGPGFILPDSPFYFLDTFVQSIRIATSFTPEQKVVSHAKIAGERLAELKLMFSRDNKTGIEIAMLQLTREIGLSTDYLVEASAKGRDISEVSLNLNEIIKEQRAVLGTLSDQADGSLRLKLFAARQELRESKMRVEDTLPEKLLQAEIAYSLQEEVDARVSEIASTVSLLESDLDLLEKQASEAASKKLAKREEAIQKAIEEKNTELQREQERLFAAEQKAGVKTVELQKESIEIARQTVKEAQEAAAKYSEVKSALSVSDIQE